MATSRTKKTTVPSQGGASAGRARPWSPGSSGDLFERAYRQGMPGPLPTQRRTAAAAAVPSSASSAALKDGSGRAAGDRVGLGVAAGTGQGPVLRAVPVESIALGGVILTPDGPLRGWVSIQGGVITAIGSRKPTDSKPLPTHGVILPGLLDLHGHPEFNVFAPWEPPRTYINRYAWRGDTEHYGKLIREPQNRLLETVPTGTQLRYAEIRAVVGGTTAIQGASRDTQGSTEPLVRNVDGLIFGHQHARAMIDLPSSITSPRGGKTLQGILEDVENGEVTAFYVHLAEGRRDNPRSVEEFTHLADLQALTSATVIIHGSALTRDQLGDAKDAGARLVWSPQSNLRLYAQTTRAADAIDLGLPIALGADWLPSGSTSLLAEMKVARHELANQGTSITADALVAMVTSGAAAVAGLADKLGSLRVGRPADLVVMTRNDADPYESVCDSTPADVELVLIGGNIVYGRTDWTHHLAADPTHSILEPVIAWGRKMLLDTSYRGQQDDSPTPRLQQLRADLVNAYPHLGPIWA